MAEGGIGLSLGVVSAVIQTYSAVTTAYDTYLGIKEFPSAYQELRVGLLIERYKLELWANQALSEEEQERAKLSQKYWPLWELLDSIFNQMLEAFRRGDQTMETYLQHTRLRRTVTFSGNVQILGFWACKSNNTNIVADGDLSENVSLAVKSHQKHPVVGFSQKVKFVLRDKKKMEQLITKLGFWNDSLDKMTSRLDQESSRRRLRSRLSTSDITQLQHLEAAASIFAHPDIQRMANIRTVIEQGTQSEMHEVPQSIANASPNSFLDSTSKYQIDQSQLHFHEMPYQTDQVRVMATYRQDSVIVDWRYCQEDTWRTKNPAAFRLRTANLTKILNSDLRPLNLSILHCVGYLDQNSDITGYAFRLPPDALPGQKPVTLYQLLTRVKSGNDIPDLGERFELAKALVSTLFEIHNIGWMHKNIQPKNILFWPKRDVNGDFNLSKPYLMGFDISRPDQPGEFSEKPPNRPEDDIYRHPDYRGEKKSFFQPSFDLYSLGIILYEIGMWRNVASQPKHRNSRTSSDPKDPQYIEKTVMSGPVLELKRYTGIRYRDAVVACLSRELDAVWEKQGVDRQNQLNTYLEQVQNKIVDAIAHCSA